MVRALSRYVHPWQSGWKCMIFEIPSSPMLFCDNEYWTALTLGHEGFIARVVWYIIRALCESWWLCGSSMAAYGSPVTGTAWKPGCEKPMRPWGTQDLGTMGKLHGDVSRLGWDTGPWLGRSMASCRMALLQHFWGRSWWPQVLMWGPVSWGALKVGIQRQGWECPLRLWHIYGYI